MFFRLAMMACLVAPISNALAAPAAEALAERLVEGLGVAEEVADEIAAILTTAQEETSALRTRAKEHVKGLAAAKKEGDVKAMRRAMADLRTVRRSIEQTREEANDDVLEQLTVEQQAAWTLFHIQRRAKAMRTLRELEAFQLDDAL